MKRHLLLGAVFALILSACSSNKEKEALKPVPLVKFDASIKLDRKWSVSVGKGQDKRYSRFVPAIEGDRVFATDIKGNVFAYDKTSGKKIWRVKTGKEISASTAVVNGQLYFGTYKGELVALSAENGEFLWQAKASSEILGVPAANSEVVVVQTIDGRAFGYSTKTGDQLWRYDHTVPSLTLRGTASPIIVRNQVITAFANGQIVSINANDGALQWTGRVSQPKGRTELEKMVDVDGTPVIDGGLIYAATYHGAVSTFSKAKGQVIWKQDISTYRNLAVDNDIVFAVNENSHLVAFSTGNGSILWTNDLMHRRNLSAPVAFADYVAVVDEDGYMHVLSQQDGKFAYRFKPKGKSFRSPMRPDGNGFLILSDDGKLSSYQLAE